MFEQCARREWIAQGSWASGSWASGKSDGGVDRSLATLGVVSALEADPVGISPYLKVHVEVAAAAPAASKDISGQQWLL